MERESFILYTSFYEPLKYLSDSQMGKLFKAIFEYQINGNTNVENEIRIAFEFIKNQLDIDAEKWKDEKQKRSEAGRLGGIKRAVNKGQKLSSTSKQCLSKLSAPKQNQTNQADNVNVNVNENVNVDVDIEGDSCVDGPAPAPASCVDRVLDFYKNNIDGMLTQHVFEVLENYRKEISDDLIILAMQKAVEAKARNINYIKAILNNWSKKGIKTLADAKSETENWNKSKNESPTVDDSWDEFKRIMQERGGA